MRRRAVGFLLVLTALVAVARLASLGRWNFDPSARSMDRDEDLSEALADSMIALADALRDGDASAAESLLTTEFSGQPAFQGAAAARELHPGYTQIEYSRAPGPAVNRSQWLGSLLRHTASWGEVEDARLKVANATFPAGDDTGSAKIRLLILGAGPDGDRRSIGGVLDARVARAGGRWRLSGAAFERLSELRAAAPPFADVTEAAGLHLTEQIPPGREKPDDLGRGAASLDFDGDGLLDLYVADPSDSSLWRNLGDGRFENVAERWGLAGPAEAPGVLALDADNDGKQDLFIGWRIWRNTGSRFVEMPSAPTARAYVMASAAAADYDGDSLLDIYLCRKKSMHETFPWPRHHATNGAPNVLLRALRPGGYADVAGDAGVAGDRWSLAAAWEDFDGDGRPDLIVANDNGDKNLYHNIGAGKFRDVARELGTLDSAAGMGVSWGDFDGDGRPDAYASNMSSTAGRRIIGRLQRSGKQDASLEDLRKLAAGNTLLRFDGKRFQDVTEAAGVADGQWAWGNAFCDVDNDGWQDLLVTNGYKTGKSKKDT